MLHLNITLLLIISLPIFTIISTVYEEVNYIVITQKQIKTRTLKILVTRVLAPLFI